MDVKSKVWEALDQAAAAGDKTPTLRILRSKIGSGSFTTISDAIKEWKIDKLAVPQTLPEKMPDEVALLISAAVWRAMSPILQQRIDEVKENAEARVKIEREAAAKIQTSADEALAEAAAKDEQLAQAQRQAENLDKKLQEAAGELRELRAAKAAIEQRCEALQNELATAQQQAAAAQAEAAAIRKLVPLLDPKHIKPERTRKG